MERNYVRVTEVLFPYSGLKNIPTEILGRAAERGTIVHTAIDAIIEGFSVGKVDINESIWGYIESFNKWNNEKDFIAKPSRFYCDDHMITGECDGIYRDGKDLVLVDFKTSLKEGLTWPLQGSAYSYLARKYGYKIARIEFIKLSKQGGAPIIYKYEENFDLFLKCLELYRIFFDSHCEEDHINGS